MKYTVETRDLFSVSDDYYMAHCISADFALGAGIALQFVNRFNMREKLFTLYGEDEMPLYKAVGKALLVDKTFNLITKPRCYHKPTYDELTNTLEDMKKQCIENNIIKIAMPQIGCGLDRLDWDCVEEIIKDVFRSTDIEILICKL